MGACGSSQNRKKKKEREKLKSLEADQGKLDENNEKTALRGANPNFKRNSSKKNYTFKIKNEETNEEITNEIPGNQTIQDLLNLIKLNPFGDYDIKIEENETSLNDDDLNTNLNILLGRLFKKNIPEIINVSYLPKGLKIPQNLKEAYIETNPIIGSAILDNPEIFGVITYENQTSSINSYYFKKKDNEDLCKFNSFTAYCNAKSKLYFSGGENEQTYDPDKTVAKYNDFFYIDLNEIKSNPEKISISELQNLNESRTWHSMIFVPNNYIFIVGGSNTKTVELFNMENQELKIDSELNETRGECTLCLVNDTFLYAFCGFLLHQEYNSSIEKCNLRKEKRTWEYVEYNTNGIIFKPSFFGVSYFKDDQILLLRDSDNSDVEQNNSNYIVKVGMENEPFDQINEVKVGENNITGVYREKFFIPVENDLAVNIPLVVGEDIQIFVLNMNTGEIKVKKENKEKNRE